MCKSYRIKLYPNNIQKQELLKYAGACRFVYNYFLDRKKTEYLKNSKNIPYNKLSKELVVLRHNTSWLKNIPFVPLQQSLRNLDTAYNKFFRKQAKFPKFKRKYSRQSIRKINGWHIKNNKIVFSKELHLKFRGRITENPVGTLTISRNAIGEWFASVMEDIEVKKVKLKGNIGIDLGIKDLAITSDGDKYKNCKPLKSNLKQLRKKSKILSKKKKGSNRRKKARFELAILHNKISNIRNNHLHHTSKAIVSKNHAIIALEDLAVINMMKNRKLSQAISDVGWAELVRQITYKQSWIGGKVIKINRFFPSSKTCSKCGFVLDSLPLNIREWQCPKCKAKHDRDVNAGKNILSQALKTAKNILKQGVAELPRVESR